MKFENLSELQAELLTKNKIVELSGKVDGDFGARFKESFEYLVAQGSPDFEVTISSGGGKTKIGLDIFYLLRSYPGKITGRVIGSCGSSATNILMGCDVRIAHPSSTVLVHHTSSDLHAGWFNLDGTPNKLGKRKIKDVLDTQEHKIKVLLYRMKGFTPTKLRKLFDENRFLEAGEALQFGLIDEIQDPCETPFEPKK